MEKNSSMINDHINYSSKNLLRFFCCWLFDQLRELCSSSRAFVLHPYEIAIIKFPCQVLDQIPIVCISPPMSILVWMFVRLKPRSHIKGNHHIERVHMFSSVLHIVTYPCVSILVNNHGFEDFLVGLREPMLLAPEISDGTSPTKLIWKTWRIWGKKKKKKLTLEGLSKLAKVR